MSPSLPFDVAEELRRKKILENMPNLKGGDVTPAQPQQPIDYRQVAGSTSYQPPAAQPIDQYPEIRKAIGQEQEIANKISPSILNPLESAGKSLEGLGPPPSRLDPQYKTGVGGKILKGVLTPLLWKSYLVNPKGTRETMSQITNPKYARATEQYEQELAARQQQYNIESKVVGDKVRIFGEQFRNANTNTERLMAAAKFNEWLRGLPTATALKAAQLAEATARAEKEQAPAYRTGTEMITYKDPDTGLPVTKEGMVRIDHKTHMPEYVIPGLKDPLKNEDIITSTKTPAGARGTIEERIALRTQAHIDAFGEPPSPELKDQWYKEIALEKQAGMSERQSFQTAQKTTLGHINKEFITPLNKRTLELQKAKTTLAAAMGETDPKKQHDAVAQVLSVLEAVRDVVGSSRVAVAEFPLITGAEGKPQSMVAWVRNLMGKGSLVPISVLKDLQKFTELMSNDVEGMMSIAQKWNSKGLDATTEQEAKAAGEGFDAERKLYQNPKGPTIQNPTAPITPAQNQDQTQQRLDRINQILRK